MEADFIYDSFNRSQGTKASANVDVSASNFEHQTAAPALRNLSEKRLYCWP